MGQESEVPPQSVPPQSAPPQAGPPQAAPPQQQYYAPPQGYAPPPQGTEYGAPPGQYPPQQQGYAPPPQGGYPPQQGAYPPQQQYYAPPPQGGYPPQGAYPPPAGAPQPTYMAAPATTVVVHTSIQFREVPVDVICGHCNTRTTTKTEYVVGGMVWLICVILILCGCWLGCCLIPFGVDSMKDVEHSCGNCKHKLHRFDRLAGK